MKILSSEYRRISLPVSSDYPRMVFRLAEAIQRFCTEILNSEFRGWRTIWCSWRMSPVAPRNVLAFHVRQGSIVRVIFRDRCTIR